ncbi:MAG: PaaI family thioesterase [Pyrinomonadaceae bacterium]|nr:PaaI family thioesterase [Pyrinomonadaceae bacterium]
MKQAALLTDALKKRLHDAFAEVPFARLLGLELGELEPGAATVYLALREDLKRNGGLLHGGVTASLIDTAAAFAAMTLLKSGESTTTVDLTIHYLRPLIEGRPSARARVLRAGRRVLVISVDVVDEREALVATALTTYLRLTENLQATSGK